MAAPKQLLIYQQNMGSANTAVVILNWNGRSFLETFMPSVIKNTPVDVEIIVADNASSDDSIDFLKKNYPSVRIISLDKNYGFAGGYNEALKHVDAPYWVLLNSDMEVSPGWIEPIIALMESDSSIAACQPGIHSFHQPTHFEHAGAAGGFLDRYGYPFCRGRIFNTLEKDTGQYDEPREVFWATGACMFVRASAFNAVGGFDSRFFAHMEEIDLCWRMKNAGMKIMVCPQSKVFHVGGGTLPKSSSRKTFLNFRNSLWLLAKNMPRRSFYFSFLIRIMLDEIAALSFLVSGNPGDFIAVFRAYFAFLGSLRQMRKHSRNLPQELPPLLYPRSIVSDYYLGKKKYFSSLDFFK